MTMYGSFRTPHDAEQAVGALLDRGAREQDLAVIASHSGPGNVSESVEAEAGAKHGISTTTAGDVAAGAVKGTVAGLGVGIAAMMAALFIPGVGIVAGAGALAIALTGVAGATAAGTVAGSVVGLLVDQGMEEDRALFYSNTLAEGGALVSLHLPSGGLETAEAEGILAKYGARNMVTTYAATSTHDPDAGSNVPVVIERTHEPVVIIDQIPVSHPVVVGQIREIETIVDADTGAVVQVDSIVTPILPRV